MTTIPEHQLDGLKDHLPAVVLHMHPGLKKSGSGYVGCCPFHDERTPSFSVHPAKRIFKCFGCGEAGDVFDFVMKLKGVSFLEAVQIVLDITGGVLDTITAAPTVAPKRRQPDVVACLPIQAIERTATPERQQVETLYRFVSSNTTMNVPAEVVASTWAAYKVGTMPFSLGDHYSPNATLYWHISNAGECCGGQVAIYDPTTPTCSKVRLSDNSKASRPSAHIALEKAYAKRGPFRPEWLKRYLDPPKGFTCAPFAYLFGSHLINRDEHRPVAIVEDPATAIIASLYLPRFVWLACGGKGNLKGHGGYERLKFLHGRRIVLFPDSEALKDWEEAAEHHRTRGLNIRVANWVEQFGVDPESKADLKDFLPLQDWATFTGADDHMNTPTADASEPGEAVTIGAETPPEVDHHPMPKQRRSPAELRHEVNAAATFTADHEGRWIGWDTKADARVGCSPDRPAQLSGDVARAVEYLEALPAEAIPATLKLSPCATITDVSKFIDSHLQYVKFRGDRDGMKPYCERLVQVYNMLISGQQSAAA